jgi:hypothetical protein
LFELEIYVLLPEKEEENTQGYVDLSEIPSLMEMFAFFLIFSSASFEIYFTAAVVGIHF